MVNLRGLLGLFILTSAVFAGCIGAESTGPTGADQQAGPASFDGDTGAIDGSITDDELQPIQGAVIGILPSEANPQAISTVSDVVGGFSLSHVPPGKHRVQATALGYESVAKDVEIVAGEVLSVSFITARLPSDGPYSQTDILTETLGGAGWRLTPECMYFTNSIPVQTQYNTLAKTCGGLGGADQPHFVDEFLRETDWKTLVAELTWTPQGAAIGRAVSMDLNAPNITRGNGGSIDQASPYTWDVESGDPPIIIRIDLPDTLVDRGIPESDWYSYPDGEGCTAPTVDDSPNCDWFIRFFAAPCDVSAAVGSCGTTPADVGLPQDLPLTLYFSYFHQVAADPTFSALPDA